MSGGKLLGKTVCVDERETQASFPASLPLSPQASGHPALPSLRCPRGLPGRPDPQPLLRRPGMESNLIPGSSSLFFLPSFPSPYPCCVVPGFSGAGPQGTKPCEAPLESLPNLLPSLQPLPESSFPPRPGFLTQVWDTLGKHSCVQKCLTSLD